jgi:hypothetical protein
MIDDVEIITRSLGSSLDNQTARTGRWFPDKLKTKNWKTIIE